jgi:hypothetical protein
MVLAEGGWDGSASLVRVVIAQNKLAAGSVAGSAKFWVRTRDSFEKDLDVDDGAFDLLGSLTAATEAMGAAQAKADQAEAEMNDLEERVLALPEGSPERLALEKEFAEKKVEFVKAPESVKAAEAAVAEAEEVAESKEADAAVVVAQDNNRVLLFISTSASKLILVHANPSSTVKDLKKLIFDHTGIPACIQKTLTFGGKNLADGDRLSDTLIENESTIWQMHGFSGGMLKSPAAKIEVASIGHALGNKTKMDWLNAFEERPADGLTVGGDCDEPSTLKGELVGIQVALDCLVVRQFQEREHQRHVNTERGRGSKGIQECLGDDDRNSTGAGGGEGGNCRVDSDGYAIDDEESSSEDEEDGDDGGEYLLPGGDGDSSTVDSDDEESSSDHDAEDGEDGGSIFTSSKKRRSVSKSGTSKHKAKGGKAASGGGSSSSSSSSSSRKKKAQVKDTIGVKKSWKKAVEVTKQDAALAGLKRMYRQLDSLTNTVAKCASLFYRVENLLKRRVVAEGYEYTPVSLPSGFWTSEESFLLLLHFETVSINLPGHNLRATSVSKGGLISDTWATLQGIVGDDVINKSVLWNILPFPAPHNAGDMLHRQSYTKEHESLGFRKYLKLSQWIIFNCLAKSKPQITKVSSCGAAARNYLATGNSDPRFCLADSFASFDSAVIHPSNFYNELRSPSMLDFSNVNKLWRHWNPGKALQLPGTKLKNQQGPLYHEVQKRKNELLKKATKASVKFRRARAIKATKKTQSGKLSMAKSSQAARLAIRKKNLSSSLLGRCILRDPLIFKPRREKDAMIKITDPPFVADRSRPINRNNRERDELTEFVGMNELGEILWNGKKWINVKSLRKEMGMRQDVRRAKSHATKYFPVSDFIWFKHRGHWKSVSSISLVRFNSPA